MTPLPSSAIELLKKPNPAVMATVRSDGTPVTAATWYLWEDGRVLLNLDEGRVRLKHLQRDPRLSLTVLDDASWYTHITLIGHVADTHPDADLADIDRLAQHYGGGQYPNRVRDRTSVWMEVDRWYGWGKQQSTSQSAGFE